MRTPLRPKDWLHDRLIGAPEDSIYHREWEPQLAHKPTIEAPISQACTWAQTRSPNYRAWCDEMSQPRLAHRKQWEWVYILRCLQLAGHLTQGKRGVGLGVGIEPITACAVKRGSEILATDSIDPTLWNGTHDAAASLSSLNQAQIVDDAFLQARARFRAIDMRAIPEDIRGYDFAWSSCALAHMGSLEAGFDFVRGSLETIKPGGTVVHTTDYNVSSDQATILSGPTVLYRKRDLSAFVHTLRDEGHSVRITFGLGSDQPDRHVDEPPFSNMHIKVRYEDYVITSFGLKITKSRNS